MITAEEAKVLADNYLEKEIVEQSIKEIGDAVKDAANAGRYFIVYDFTEKNPHDSAYSLNDSAYSLIESKLRELGYIVDVTLSGKKRNPIWVFEIRWKPIEVRYTSAFDDIL